MQLSSDQIEAATNYAWEVRMAAMTAISGVKCPTNLPDDRVITASIDGLIAAAAMYAQASGICPSSGDKRRLSDQVKVAMLKNMKSAELELGDRADEFAAMLRPTAH